MLHPSTQKLIQKLCELTEGGDIVWKEGKDGHSSIFETEGYKVEIDGEPPVVRLLASDGRELEKADAGDLALAWPGGDGTFAVHVSDMARQAHRIASGAEAAISRILSSLSAPPQKAPTPLEPEPVPTAIEFDPPEPRKAGPVAAAESAASMAAIAGDMARRPPEPAPAPVATLTPKAATALASMMEAEASPAEIEPAIAAAEEELPLEDAPAVETKAPPAPIPQPAPPAPAPQPVATQPAAPPVDAAPEDRPFPLVTAAAPRVEPPKPQTAPQPAVQPAAPRPAFGATSSFAAATPAPTPAPPVAKPAAPTPPPRPATSPLFVTGFSAVSKPVVRLDASPMPPPVAPSAPQPAPPKVEAKPEPEMAGAPPKTGPDIYKPWS